MSINRVLLGGNLTREPELRMTAGGVPVLQMGLAVNDRARNGRTGELEERPCFVDLAMFGRRAEALRPQLSKGDKVVVEGALRWSQWERDGQRHQRLSVTVTDVELMRRRGGGQGTIVREPLPVPGHGGGACAVVAEPGPVPQAAKLPATYDDVPF